MRLRSKSRTSKEPFRRVRLHLEELEPRDMPSSALGGPGALTIDSGDYAANDIIVRWRQGGPAATPLSTGAVPLGNNTYGVELAAGVSVAKAVNYYSSLTGVDFAQPDYVVTTTSVAAPSDPYLSSQWYLGAIDAQAAWNVTTGGGRILVAVIDTGVASDTDLAPNLIAGYNYLTGTTNAADDNGHGTIVAGEIAAVGNNGIGIAGIDWNAEIMPLKFLDADGNGYLSDAVSAINRAVGWGAKIINASWGGGAYDSAMASAIQNAQAQGVIFVAAAGNNGSNDDFNPEYPANYAYNNVVSVAATDQNNNIASFSDYGGRSVSIAAPGVSILSTAPGNTYEYYSGTSMAAPLVTGALALVWSVHPTWTYTQVIADVLDNTDKLPSLSGKVETGLLDVGKAIKAALPATASAPTVTAPAPAAATTPTGVTTASASGAVSYSSNNISLAVASPGTATATITINKHEPIAALTASVNLKDVTDGEVNVSLVSPTGFTVLLFNHRGGSGQNLTNTTFTDASLTPLYKAAAPFTGAFRPEYALAAFKKLDAFGTWKLVITNLVKNNATTLLNWSLTVTPSNAVAAAGDPTGNSIAGSGFLVAPSRNKSVVAAWIIGELPSVITIPAGNSAPVSNVGQQAAATGSPYVPAATKTILFAADENDPPAISQDADEVDRLVDAVAPDESD